MNKLTLLAGLATALIASSANAVLLGTGTGGAITDPGGLCGQLGGAATSMGSINIAAGTVMQANDFTVTITGLSHTWMGDLAISLVGPSGTISLLDQFGGGDGVCGSSADFTNATMNFVNGAAAFAGQNGGTFAPGNNGGSTWNSGFGTALPGNGANIGGTWTLVVNDVSGGDIGSIASWSINGTAAVPGPASLALLGVAGLAGRRRRA